MIPGSVPEWLTGLPRKQMGFARASSNLVAVERLVLPNFFSIPPPSPLLYICIHVSVVEESKVRFRDPSTQRGQIISCLMRLRSPRSSLHSHSGNLTLTVICTLAIYIYDLVYFISCIENNGFHDDDSVLLFYIAAACIVVLAVASHRESNEGCYVLIYVRFHAIENNPKCSPFVCMYPRLCS